MADLSLGLGLGRSAPSNVISPYPANEYSLSFNGTNAFVTIVDNNTLSFGDGVDDSPFSISAWIRMDDAANFPIISKGVYNTTGEWSLRTTAAGKITLYLYDETEADTFEGSYYNVDLAPYEGIWTHICFTADGRGGNTTNEGIAIYLNGSSVTTSDTSGGSAYVAMENLAADVYIGRYDTDYADGLIDEVAIFDKVLSPTEVENIYNDGAASDLQEISNLIGYWTFNDGTSAFDTHTSEEVLGTDLITNGTMEADANWGAGYQAPDSQGQSDEEAYAGGFSWKWADEASGGIRNTTAFTTVTGKTYKLSYWIHGVHQTSHRLTLVDGNGATTITAKDGVNYSDRIITGQTLGEWNEIVIYYVETFGGNSGYLQIENPGASGTYYVDNVSLKEVTNWNSGTRDGATHNASVPA